MSHFTNPNPQNEIVLYQPDSALKLEVRLENETVWLSQAQMAELFHTTRNNITMHISNIFKEGELEKKVVCKDFLHTTPHGAMKGATQTLIVVAYNLDVIISVGYRVKSRQGTLFRQWATRVLKDYLLRGYAVNFLRNCADGTLEAFNVSNRRWSASGASAEPADRQSPLAQPRQGLNKVGHSAPAGAGTVGGTVRRFRSRLGCAPRTSLHRRLLTSRTSGAFVRCRRLLTSRTSGADRFLLVDDTVYHVGASLKDLGKKLFAFSKMEAKSADILKNVSVTQTQTERKPDHEETSTLTPRGHRRDTRHDARGERGLREHQRYQLHLHRPRRRGGAD